MLDKKTSATVIFTADILVTNISTVIISTTGVSTASAFTAYKSATGISVTYILVFSIFIASIPIAGTPILRFLRAKKQKQIFGTGLIYLLLTYLILLPLHYNFYKRKNKNGYLQPV